MTLKQYFSENNISFGTVAAATSISKSNLTRFANGDSELSLTNAYVLALYLGLNIEDIYEMYLEMIKDKDEVSYEKKFNRIRKIKYMNQFMH